VASHYRLLRASAASPVPALNPVLEREKNSNHSKYRKAKYIYIYIYIHGVKLKEANKNQIGPVNFGSYTIILRSITKGIN